ncbi:hypothetical protein [Desulfovibrio sp. 1214_IL3152]|uniref:hypothetical protein n=1 Tax=Desulfovibrio sp. 1214_IL3152 TaxID=3084056 RepID=UPI002FDAA7FB
MYTDGRRSAAKRLPLTFSLVQKTGAGQQGYEEDDIAKKTNLGKDYIRGILRLLEQGEEYLVNSVEKGRIPLYQALIITTDDDVAVQRALAKAYESGALTGKKILAQCCPAKQP